MDVAPRMLRITLMEGAAPMAEEAIPSRHQDLLRSIRGSSVVRLTRYSWAPKEEVAVESGLPFEWVFSRTAGPLLITLQSGLAIGVASQPALISVTLWVDGTPGMAADPDLHPIEADDAQFSEPGFAQMLGKRVTAIAILKRKAANLKWQDRPRESGVRISFDGAPDLILSHGLHDDSDDFSVLLRQAVRPSLRSRLEEVLLPETSAGG